MSMMGRDSALLNMRSKVAVSPVAQRQTQGPFLMKCGRRIGLVLVFFLAFSASSLAQEYVDDLEALHYAVRVIRYAATGNCLPVPGNADTQENEDAWIAAMKTALAEADDFFYRPYIAGTFTNEYQGDHEEWAYEPITISIITDKVSDPANANIMTAAVVVGDTPIPDAEDPQRRVVALELGGGWSSDFSIQAGGTSFIAYLDEVVVPSVSDGFEDTDVGNPPTDWSPNPAVGDLGGLYVVDAPIAAGTRALKVASANTEEGFFLTSTATTGEAEVSFEIYLPASAPADTRIACAWLNGVCVTFRTNGVGDFEIGLGNGPDADAVTLEEPLVPGAWNTIHLSLKWLAGQVDEVTRLRRGVSAVTWVVAVDTDVQYEIYNQTVRESYFGSGPQATLENTISASNSVCWFFDQNPDEYVPWLMVARESSWESSLYGIERDCWSYPDDIYVPCTYYSWTWFRGIAGRFRAPALTMFTPVGIGEATPPMAEVIGYYLGPHGGIVLPEGFRNEYDTLWATLCPPTAEVPNTCPCFEGQTGPNSCTLPDWEHVPIGPCYAKIIPPSVDDVNHCTAAKLVADSTCPDCGSPVYTIDEEDLSVTVTDTPIWVKTAEGPILAVQLAYHHENATEIGDFGRGWRWNYAMTISDYGNDVKLVTTGGAQDAWWFISNQDGTYSGPPSLGATLTDSGGGTWTLTKHEGEVYTFTSGCLVSISDLFGHTLTLTYDGNSRIASMVDDTGNSMSFTRNADGYVSSISESGGRSATFTYDDNGFLTGTVDMADIACTYEYDWADPVDEAHSNTARITKISTSVTETSSRDTTFAYAVSATDSQQELTVTDPEGNQTTLRWDHGNTEVFTRIDPNGGTTSKLFERIALREVLTAKIDALGNGWTYEYDAKGHLAKRVDPLGNETTYTRNGYGQVLTETHPGGATTTYSYADNGLDILTETDPLENVTTYIYDTDRNLLSVSKVIDAQTSETTTYTYDSNGRRLTETLPTGRVTTNTYDTNGRLTSTTVSGEGTTMYTYNTRGLVATITKPDGLVIAKNYDDLDRVTVETYQGPDPAGNTTQTTTYGCCGIQQTIDRKGTISNYEYDANGRRTAVIDHFGSETQFEYDAVGNKTILRDALGNEVLITYDLLQRPCTITYPDGTTESNIYDDLGRVIQQTDRQGLVFVTEYDVRGNVTARKVEVAGDPDPVVYTLETSTYNLGNQIVSSTNADGLTVTYTYDAAGRQTSATYPDSTSVTQSYDEDGLLQSTTDRLDNTTSYTYDSYGRLLTVTDALNNVTTYAYNNTGKRASVTDALNRTTGYTYDHESRQTVTTYPDTTTETRSYSPAGLLTSVTDRTSITTSSTYDAMGRRLTQAIAGNTVSTVTYDELGRVVTRTNAEGITVTMTYDSMGREIRSTMPDGTYSETTYGPSGVLTQTDRGGAVTTYTYDAFGRRASETNPKNETIAYRHDVPGRITKLTDANGNETQWTYNTEGKLVTKTYADSSTYQYTYDVGGRMLTRTDAKNQTTSYSYDALGRLTDVDYPTDTDIGHTYDALGRKLTMTDSSGTTSYTYDPQTGYPATVDGPFDNDTLTYSWDATGRRTGTSLDGTSVATYDYDTMGRMSTVTGNGTLATGTAVQFTYTYNGAGNSVTGITAPGSITTTKVYDTLGRLSSTSASGPAPQSVTLSAFAYTYDDHDRRTQVDLPGSGRWEYSYDAAGQVTGGNRYGLRQSDGTEAGLAQYGYEYDAMGNPTERSEDVGVSEYTYNNLNQLVTGDWSGQLSVFGSTETQGLDSVSVATDTQTQTATVLQTGELTAKGFNVPAGETAFTVARTATDQTTTQTSTAVTRPASQTQFSHDLNGNMLGEGKWTYTWNEENRLVSATSTPKNSPTHKLSFTYDGQGRRRIKREYTWAGNAWELSRTTNYIWDGWLLLSERTMDSEQRTTDKSYICGADLSGRLGGEGTDAMATAGGIGGILAVSSSNATLLFLYDGDGNVVDLVSPLTTDIVAHYEYSPFGRTIIAVGPLAETNTIRFSAKAQDTTGLYYYGLRYYSPKIARWLNRDPLAEQGGENLYGFVDNTPVGSVDPFGDNLLGVVFAMGLGQSMEGLKGSFDVAVGVGLAATLAAATFAYLDCDLLLLRATNPVQYNLTAALASVASTLTAGLEARDCNCDAMAGKSAEAAAKADAALASAREHLVYLAGGGSHNNHPQDPKMNRHHWLKEIKARLAEARAKVSRCTRRTSERILREIDEIERAIEQYEDLPWEEF